MRRAAAQRYRAALAAVAEGRAPGRGTLVSPGVIGAEGCAAFVGAPRAPPAASALVLGGRAAVARRGDRLLAEAWEPWARLDLSADGLAARGKRLVCAKARAVHDGGRRARASRAAGADKRGGGAFVNVAEAELPQPGGDGAAESDGGWVEFDAGRRGLHKARLWRARALFRPSPVVAPAPADAPAAASADAAAADADDSDARWDRAPRAARCALELELSEARVDTDPMQELHLCENLATVLDANGDDARESDGVEGMAARAVRLRDEINEEFRGPVAVARLQLDGAKAAVDQLLARRDAARQRRGAGTRARADAWWARALAVAEAGLEHSELAALVADVADELGGAARGARGADGVVAALELATARAADARAGALRCARHHAARPSTPAERVEETRAMAQTGDCQKCAADFGRTGPVCEHCRRETNLIDYMRSLTDWNIRIGEDGEPSYWYDAPCANALRELQRRLGGARARALWRGGDATEAELLLLREEAEAEVAAWGAHRVGALPSDSDAGMKHEWLVARRCWREAGLLLLRLDEAQQAVATAELLPAGDDHLARRTAMREDVQRLYPLPSELPTLQLQSVTDEYEAAKELSKRESKIAFLLRCREQAWHVEPGAHDSAENSCSICLEPLRTPAPARGAAAGDAPAMLSITPCSHAFHAACLDRWLRRGASRGSGCPNCKAGVDPDDVRRATGLARDDGTVVSGGARRAPVGAPR